jgi:tetratricopeptide (TPR) repeat protein
VLGKEHDNSKALFRRAKAFVGIEDYERAFDDLTLLLKVDPKSSNGIELLEQVKAHLKSAEENLSKIYKENGNSSMTAGNFHDAINWYTQSIDTDRCNVASYNNRSLAYLKTAQFDLAKSDASFVLKEGKNLVSEGEWKSLAKKALSRKVECGIELAKEIEDSEKKRNELNEVLLDLDALKSIEHDEALISGLEKSINQQLNALTSTTSSPTPSPPSTKAKRSEAKSKSPKDPPKSYYE